MSRKMLAAIATAPSALARRSRLKSKIVNASKMPGPATAQMMSPSNAKSGRLVDDCLDRSDHGVRRLVEDLRVLVGRCCKYGHALVALLGVGGSSAHRAHLVLGGAR